MGLTNIPGIGGHRAVVVLLLLLCHALLLVVPSPSASQDLDTKIKALAEQLVEREPLYKDETFRKLSNSTQEAVKLLDTYQIQIGLYKISINELKRKPSLTHEQLRWLVEIEDLFVRAEGQFRAARGMYILSDENSGFLDRSGALGGAIRDLGEASRNFDKGKRDLATLRTRVEVQAKPR